jgi:hypothetical protein
MGKTAPIKDQSFFIAAIQNKRSICTSGHGKLQNSGSNDLVE